MKYRKRGIVHYIGRNIMWTGEMLSLLRKFFPNTDNRELAGMLGISIVPMIRKALALGLRKSESYMHEIRSRAQRMSNLKRKLNKHKREKENATA